MKVINFFKNLIRRFLNISSDSNYLSGLNWFNAAPAGGYGRYGNTQTNQTDVSTSPDFKKYTVEEVKAYLRGLQSGERARPVMEQASIFSILLQERMRRHFRGRERIFERLPYVLYQYTQGRDASEIAHSVSYFADSDDIEHAMNFAANLIADKVNRTTQRGLHL